MILNRPLAAWDRLVAAIAALVILTVAFVNPSVNIAQLVAGVVTVASAILAILANQSVTGSLLGPAK